jgi:Chlorophyll A-B binding protein
MFAFVGYIVHANGIKFPWAMELDGTPFPSVTSAPEAWDQISDAAKWQIFIFIGFLEYVSLPTSAGGVRKVGVFVGDFPLF